MDGFLIVLFILILFVIIIVFAVINNSRSKEVWRAENESPYSVYTIAGAATTGDEFPASSLDSHRSEDLIAAKRQVIKVVEEPKFEYANNTQSQPVAREGDYVSEKSYSSRNVATDNQYSVVEKSDGLNKYDTVVKSETSNKYDTVIKSEASNKYDIEASNKYDTIVKSEASNKIEPINDYRSEKSYSSRHP
jgi:hypothetical protein